MVVNAVNTEFSNCMVSLATLKSVIVSICPVVVNLKISLPPSPVNIFVPVPPSRLSFPRPPLRSSFPLSP